MRIAIDLTSLGGNYTGIEQYAYHIAQTLIQQNTTNAYDLFFCGDIFEPLAKLVNGQEVRAHVLPQKGKLGITQILLPRSMAQIDADVFLFPAFPQPLTFLNSRSVSVIHDVSFWDCPQTFTKKSLAFWRMTSRHAARRNLIITVSHFSRRRIAECLHVPIEHIAVVPNGVDPLFLKGHSPMDEVTRRRLLTTYHLPERFVLCLCTLEPRKNLPFLVEAWILAHEYCDDVPDLVLAGRHGWKLDDLLSSVPSLLAPHIHLTGFVDGEDLPHLYGLCECFVYPSTYEGFGLPPLEAYAAGAPVLCSDIDVFHETCEGLASFFPLDDPKQLAHMLVEPHFRTSPSMGEYICDRYSWDKSAHLLLKALERYVNTR